MTHVLASLTVHQFAAFTKADFQAGPLLAACSRWLVFNNVRHVVRVRRADGLQAGRTAQPASAGWMGVLKQHCADLEVGLAQEHQNRVRQEREKVGLTP